MKLLFLIYYLIIQITIIQAKNQYLGCFVDQIGNRDLNIFIGDYEQLIPKQCILACQEQNYLYAAIQYGNECRCGQHYGKYGQVSDDECDYLCSTAEKCGGDNRNSVYKAVTSINILNTGLTCQNNLIGYQGCFDSVTLTNGMDVVNSIEECIKRCVVKYNYAGVMNGNLCYCENDLNLPSVNSNLCNIQCNKNTNDKTINCCGGLHVLSVYNIKNYQSSLLEDFSEKLIRAANESTYIPSYTTDVSSISTSLNNSTSLQTESFTGIASQSSITANSLPISSTISSLLNLNTNINEPVSSIPSTMSEVTSTTPISSTNTAEMLITTAYLSTNTTTSTGTSTLSTIIAASINSISISQPATNPMSSAESSSMYSIISETGTPSSSNIYTRAAITNTVATVSTPSAAFTSESFVQTSASGETSIGTASPLNMISSQTSQPLETTISINPISSISISNILTSIYMGNTESVTSSPITEFSSNSGNQPTNSINTVISSTSTMTSVPMLSELVSTASTNLFQTSTVSTSLNSISSNSITSNNLSSFSSIMTAESPSISSLTSMASSQVTETIFQQTNSQLSIPNTLFLSINSLSSSSTNIGLQTTITSSFSTAITTEQTTVTSSNISSTTVITPETVNSTVSTTQASTTTTTVASSNVITTVIIVPSNQNFTPNANATQELISTRLSAIIDLGFQCLYNPSNPNCTQTSGRKKRQLCQTGYNVNLVSNINEVSNTASSANYMIDYTVTNPCNQDALVPPAQVRTATDTLSRTQITNLLGYDYVGDLIQSTSIGNTSNPTTDNKLWIIGAVLGPVAFVLLLIFVFCYLHYKCRPRPTNRALAKAISNAPPVVAARATTYQIVSNESVKEKPTTEKNIQILTQNDPLVGASTSSRQLTPIQSEKITHNTHEHPVVSNEISLDEIRRQNDVERWRNKLRLQEKFQVNFFFKN